MENKKNNAIEKVENIIEGEIRKKKGSKTRTQSSGKTHKKNKTVKSSARAEKRREMKRKREAEKAERERIRAQKRLEEARLKAHKKAEKQKAKAAALREKNRRIAEAKARRENIRAERQKRRDMLKNETKKQRRERIAEERAAKMRMKEQENARRAEEKRRKFLAKKEARERRAANRQKNREKNKGTGGWLAAVISLGVCSLVLASVLTFTFLMPNASDNMLEAGYQKSFYDTVEQVNNMDLNLSKVLATSDGGATQLYLTDLAVNSELAENDIQQLPLHDESKYYTTKIINQIGDYAKYLNKKLINGEKLTDEDYSNLTRLYQANLAIKNSLDKMMEGMGADYSFSSLNDGGEGNLVISNFNELQNLSVEYPELIYDGPFSDGQDRKEIKGLGEGTIDRNGAQEIFIKAFGGYGLGEVKDDGTTEGIIRCFNVSAEVEGNVLYAQISEQGGKIIMFAYSGNCREVMIDGDSATEQGLKFLNSLGITEMKPVWINLSNNVYTINFAATEQDVIIYSDLVKIRVCAETGKVIGMEAMSYYTNHTERMIEAPALSRKQAQEKVSGNIDVVTARLAIIPLGEKTEKLCYEFSGTFDGATYYVYIDAMTGRQVEMFKVVKSTEGELLM